MLRIRFERISRRLSQKRVGDIARIPQPTICLIETGRIVPAADELSRLAAVFNVNPDDLLKDVVVLGPSR